ncbi:pantoate--beta-alanine ligase [Paenibacillus marinisediminis]
MKVATTIEQLKAALTAARREHTSSTVGFVPTMGYLHQGHASLLKRAVAENDVAVLSIFLNPIQFGPNEDLDRYPRDEQRDLALAEECGVDIVFLPTVEVMYPQPTKTKVVVSELTGSLCGASRPGHFDGVTTVVSKLFHMVKPDRAYFGMKDAQQVAVITQMVQDLNMDLEIVPCPIVREADGLALSSRNVYLSEQERAQALKLSESLSMVENWIASDSELTVGMLRDRIMAWIRTAPLANIEYTEIISFPSLEPVSMDTLVQERTEQWLIALAVRYGNTRLIDNKLLLDTKGE